MDEINLVSLLIRAGLVETVEDKPGMTIVKLKSKEKKEKDDLRS